ncbi:MAG: type III-A CRISPR-associated RAMP protein Csm3 [Candidatus Caenarcaniphilales bacterium]|nr:type III-A CRISPR-associated RAMP protein Csm3 [Candidatus Caenarcaniphilales bacterium]
MSINGIAGSIKFEGIIECLTGMHIGAGKDNAAIGAVDMTVVRDPLTRQPIIPGSSLKGKIRTLLAKSETTKEKPFLKEINNDDQQLKDLFGATSPRIIVSRLQFHDCKLTEDSLKQLETLDTDLYLTEIKYENTINRTNSQATPRQMERVVAGSEFAFKLTYMIEEGLSEEVIKSDLEKVVQGIKLLEDDYLGGHGTRGSGRVKFKNIEAKLKAYSDKDSNAKELEIFQEDIDFLIKPLNEELIGAGSN